jgi:hypothetical protein
MHCDAEETATLTSHITVVSSAAESGQRELLPHVPRKTPVSTGIAAT